MGAGNVEDIYELSPLQRGMLLHSAHDGATDMYVSQQTYLVEGKLDPGALAAAWQAVVAGHPALRTSFHWEGLDKPLQVVHREVALPVRHHDLSGVDEDGQRRRFEKLASEDAAAGFDLSVAPLQRLHLVRFGADRFGLVWTYHHLLLDGWSIPTLLGDVLGHYRALTTGGPPPPPARPFRDHLAWLQRQDPEAGRRFWVDLFAGATPNRLVPLRPWDPRHGTGPVDRRDIRLTTSWMRGVRAAAARHRVTLGTMMYAAWATVLRRYSDLPDVSFGCVTSGRPAELPQVDRIIGVLANTLPVRLAVPDGGDLTEWLREVQHTCAQVRRYEYTPLADIKKWAGASGRQLFDSTLSIDNYSIAVDTTDLADQLSFRPDALYDKINYPIAVTIAPEFGSVQVLVHRQRFTPDFVDDVLSRLQATLEALTTATSVDELAAAAGPAAAPEAAAEPAASVDDPEATEPPSRQPAPPATPLEHAIAEVYREILETPDIDVTASFFSLGGDSFDAVRAISRIDGATVGMLAANPSVRELARALAPTTASTDLDDEISQLEDLLTRKRAERARHNGTAELVPVPRDGPMVCTYQQEGMWFMNQFAPTWTSYHVPIPLRLHGALDVPALERAMNALVVRHEALRTRFVNESGLPRQVIDPPPASTTLPVVDLTADQVVAWATDVYAQPFDLAAGPAFRVGLARLAPDEHALVMVFHHIVTDGWSGRVLADELSVLYAAERSGSAAELPPLHVQPADYAAWQRRWLNGAERDRQIGRWRDALTDLGTVDFPADRPRPAQPIGTGANVFRILPPEVATAARDYTRTHQVSLLAVLHAGLLTVLHRYTGQRDLPVGSLLTGRTRGDIEPMVGYFGSIVVLRTDLGGDPTFADLVRRCHDTVLDATTRQDTPFSLVVDALRPERVAGRNPLFQIGLVLHPHGIVGATLRLDDLTGEQFELEDGYALWDVAIDVIDAPDGSLYVSIDYSSELFDADRMERLAEHFGTALAGGLAAPDTPAADVEIVAAAERHQVLHEFGRGAQRPDTVPLVHRMVETAAAHTPEALAVVDHDGGTLTYRQLDEAANRLAHRLRRHGVGPRVPVGLRLRHGADLVTALLAVWKAGGCHVPLDPDLPADGPLPALAGTYPPVVVTHSGHDRFGSALALDAERAGLAAEPATAPGEAGTPDDPAVVLRTGGNATAVCVPHRAVQQQIARLQDTVQLQPTDRVLHHTPYGFQGSVSELFWPLTTGAAVVLAAPVSHPEPAYLRALTAREQVTTMHLVPTTLRAFLDEAESLPDSDPPSSLRRVLCSGEALPADTVRRFLAGCPGVDLYNVWAAPETTDVTVWRAEPGTTVVPLGRPGANLRTYVLDDRLRPVPIGVPGRLFVAGDGLAYGYPDRPALTAERFIPDPHTERPGQRMYATGDLVRWRADGLLEYVCRADRRVTLRGERIEPGRIEDVLAGHSGVRHCAVVPSDGGELTGYVVPRPGHGELDLTEVRRYLADRLPTYLVPARLVRASELPVTPDGRLHLAGVPDPAPPAGHVPPRTDTERWLAAAWQDLIGVARVGAGDSFFALGGNSLHATQLVARIRAGLSVDLHVRHLFTNPTLEQLAALVDEAATGLGTHHTADGEELDEHRELSDRAIR